MYIFLSPLSELDGAVSCAKTGLGSSAALTTSLVSCLLQWFEVSCRSVVPVVLACGLCEQVLCVSVFPMQRYVFACAFLAYVKHFCSLVVLLHRWAVEPTGFVLCVVSALSSGARFNRACLQSYR
jgi:hypothetical protein